MSRALTYCDPGDEDDFEARQVKLAADIAAAFPMSVEEAVALVRSSIAALKAPADGQTCDVCGTWNAGTCYVFEAQVCGRASCLKTALDRQRAA